MFLINQSGTITLIIFCNEHLLIANMSSKYVSKEGKVLLKNTIQSLNFQNKKLEEDLMWKRHSSQNEHCGNETLAPRKRRRSDHSEENIPTCSPKSKSWTHKLLKEEKKHSERWGHSGYQELYPDEFEGSSPDSEASSCSPRHSSKKHKSKKKKKSKKHKKHKHKKKKK